MNKPREIAYRIDPVLWVREILGVTPATWQETFLRAPRGASILALTARQVGKTTTAAWAIAHFMRCYARIVVCDCLSGATPKCGSRAAGARGSHQGGRRARERQRLRAGAKERITRPGAPGSDNSIRGLTVDGWIVADEAARLPNDLIAALRPMRARRPQARFAMLSTAWSRTDPFWTAWAGDEQSWIRLKATADEIETFSPEFLEQERIALGEDGFKREYLGIPSGGHVSPFTWELYERATQIHTPLVPPGPAFGPPVPERAVPTANPFQRLKPNGELQ